MVRPILATYPVSCGRGSWPAVVALRATARLFLMLLANPRIRCTKLCRRTVAQRAAGAAGCTQHPNRSRAIRQPLGAPRRATDSWELPKFPGRRVEMHRPHAAGCRTEHHHLPATSLTLPPAAGTFLVRPNIYLLDVLLVILQVNVPGDCMYGCAGGVCM